ncbi:Protein CBG24330 [Caenorhabditis briggsae]|uniref:Protein CBG24330 n=1 Tax=Caenorhabditis briggsae TaxID=6238 RepID=A8WKH1_CAEBR|nr:Protein CBG24330 [Caenorhabditis briggsae]CAP20966.2 Protein CBG24330 [Caenorhabditis briggsae]
MDFEAICLFGPLVEIETSLGLKNGDAGSKCEEEGGKNENGLCVPKDSPSSSNGVHTSSTNLNRKIPILALIMQEERLRFLSFEKSQISGDLNLRVIHLFWIRTCGLVEIRICFGFVFLRNIANRFCLMFRLGSATRLSPSCVRFIPLFAVIFLLVISFTVFKSSGIEKYQERTNAPYVYINHRVYRPFGYEISKPTLPVPTLKMLNEPTCELVFSEWLRISQEPQTDIPQKEIPIRQTDQFLLNGYAALGSLEYAFYRDGVQRLMSLCVQLSSSPLCMQSGVRFLFARVAQSVAAPHPQSSPSQVQLLDGASLNGISRTLFFFMSPHL